MGSWVALGVALAVGVGLGAALLAVGARDPAALKATLDRMSPDGEARSFPLDRVVDIVHRARLLGATLLVLAAVAAAGLGAARRWFGRALAQAVGAAARTPRTLLAFCRDEPQHATLLALLIATATLARVAFLSMEIRGDEAATYNYFASKPLVYALTDYMMPNNHLLLTALSHFSVGLFGDATWALRLPALVAGVLTVPAVYALARSLFDRRVALVSAGIATGAPYLVFYSVSARGYSLLTLATVLLMLLAARAVRRDSPAAWLLLPVVATFGFYAIPTMAFPVAAVGLWMAAEIAVTRRGDAAAVRVRRLVAAALATGALTLFVYTPVLVVSGPAALLDNRFVAPMESAEFRTQMLSRGAEFVGDLHAGLPAWCVALLLVGLAASLLAHRGLARHRVPWLLALFVGAAAVLAVVRSAPFGRVWVYVVPIVIVLVASGWIFALDRLALPARARATAAAGLALAAATLLVTLLLVNRGPESIPDGACFLGARDVLAWLGAHAGREDHLLATWPPLPILEYYAPRMGLSPDFVARDLPLHRYTYLVLDLPRVNAEAGAAPGDRELLDCFNEKMRFLDMPTLAPTQIERVQDFPAARLYRLKFGA